jgi:hypothetical protein
MLVSCPGTCGFSEVLCSGGGQGDGKWDGGAGDGMLFLSPELSAHVHPCGQRECQARWAPAQGSSTGLQDPGESNEAERLEVKSTIAGADSDH